MWDDITLQYYKSKSKKVCFKRNKTWIKTDFASVTVGKNYWALKSEHVQHLHFHQAEEIKTIIQDP